MKSIIYTFLLLTLILFSCEEQMVVIPDIVVPETDKVVLVEELTGVSCPNCPKGAATVMAILDQFEGKVVAYEVHGNLLTDPLPESKYDFRNPDAIELEEFLKPFWGKPSASINRVLFDGQDFASTTIVDLWPSFVEEELQKPQVLDIVIAPSYDPSNRTAQFNVGVSAIDDIEGNLQLHVGIIDSHLIDPQEDNGAIIPDFEHNHVLKELLTQISGDDVANGMQSGDNVSRAYNYTVPAENIGEWKIENMEVVAFITSSNANGEVLQAASVHIN